MFVKANAKINVYLDVVGKRKDGYHDLDMVMLPLELHDTIEVEYLPYLTETYVVCDRVDHTETSYDSIRKTLNLLREKYGFAHNFNITIHKEIPICAGLGGGSSNAAAVLKAFEKIIKIKMEPEDELKFCLALGADVPFCMNNAPAHVQGIGEKLEPINLKDQYSVLIIKPKTGLSTPKVFGESDKYKLKHGNSKDVIKALEEGNDELLAQSMFNSLEEVSSAMCPEIQEVRKILENDGFKCVVMTGSGSCVFALTKDHIKAYNKYLKYDRKGFDVILTKTLKQKRKWFLLNAMAKIS